jgi:hypothetical protein
MLVMAVFASLLFFYDFFTGMSLYLNGNFTNGFLFLAFQPLG